MAKAWKPAWGSRTFVMGVLNVTPDSFSGDGVYMRPREVAARAETLVQAGADVLDIGGESTRPGYEPVACEEELSRVLPALEAVLRAVSIPISVDTSKAGVAERALERGASIINDVSGLHDPRMPDVVAAAGGTLVLVHHGAREGRVALMPSIVARLRGLILEAEADGIDRDRILVDPGLGMGKGWRENFEIMRELEALRELQQPVLIGPSRKGMIGRVLNAEAQDRLEGSLALVALCVARGADVVRVHDVWETVQAARVMDAIVRA